MNKEWNRRDFIVKPILWAGAARMLAGTNLLAESADTAPGPLLERTLGRTGLKLPIVSMGVMNADVPGILRRSYELGICHFDTAAVYQNGRNEEMVGSVIKEMGIRDKVVISTKVGTRASQSVGEAKKRFIDGVEASLRRLQMDHVDILYHHGVDSADHAKAEGPIDALQTLKKEGKTRFIGISTHDTVEVLNAVIPLDVFDVALVTLNYTMAQDAEKLATIEKAAKSGIGIVAMKTQAGGTVRPDSIPGFSTYEHLEQDFSVVRNLAYTDAEKKFLADKTFVAQAEFCQQCGQCRDDCPRRVDIPLSCDRTCTPCSTVTSAWPSVCWLNPMQDEASMPAAAATHVRRLAATPSKSLVKSPG